MWKLRLSICLVMASLLVLGAPLMVHAPPPDTTPPSIGTPVISPSSPSASDIVTILVNVTDNRSVQNVTIVYTTDNWQSVNTTVTASYNATTTTATGQIPALSSGGHVAYYIVALDKATGVSIAHRAVRLRTIQRTSEKAEQMGNLALVLQCQENAAKQVEGGYSNRREITGKDGKDLPIHAPVNIIQIPDNGRGVTANGSD